MFKKPLKWLLGIISDSLTGGMDSSFLFASLDGNSTIWSMIQSGADGVFRTLALAIVACFVLIEFINISDRFSSNQLQDMLKPVVVVFAKCALMIVLVNQAVPFLNTIFNGFLDAQARLSGALGGGITMDGFSALDDIVDDMALGTQIVAFFILVLTAIAAWIVSLFAKIIAIGRLIQLYLLIAVSPLPLATLTNSEFSQIGKGYLKSFISCCVQGLILVLVLNLLPALSTLILAAGTGVGVIDGLAGLFSMLASTVVLIATFFAAIKGSKKLADTVCGAF